MGKAARLHGAYCCYCVRPLHRSDAGTALAATIDHVNPTARREGMGERGKGRWVPCCFFCNQLKGAIHPDEWFWFVRSHARYWRTFTTNYQVRMLLVEERSRRARACIEPLTREPMIWIGGTAFMEMPGA